MAANVGQPATSKPPPTTTTPPPALPDRPSGFSLFDHIGGVGVSPADVPSLAPSPIARRLDQVHGANDAAVGQKQQTTTNTAASDFVAERIEMVLRDHSGSMTSANLGSVLSGSKTEWTELYTVVKTQHGGLFNLLAAYPDLFQLIPNKPLHHVVSRRPLVGKRHANGSGGGGGGGGSHGSHPHARAQAQSAARSSDGSGQPHGQANDYQAQSHPSLPAPPPLSYGLPTQLSAASVEFVPPEQQQLGYHGRTPLPQGQHSARRRDLTPAASHALLDSELEAVAQATKEILLEAADNQLRANMLANSLRARVGTEILARVRRQFGGLLTLLEKRSDIFIVHRVPKLDTVGLVPSHTIPTEASTQPAHPNPVTAFDTSGPGAVWAADSDSAATSAHGSLDSETGSTAGAAVGASEGADAGGGAGAEELASAFAGFGMRPQRTTAVRKPNIHFLPENMRPRTTTTSTTTFDSPPSSNHSSPPGSFDNSGHATSGAAAMPPGPVLGSIQHLLQQKYQNQQHQLHQQPQHQQYQQHQQHQYQPMPTTMPGGIKLQPTKPDPSEDQCPVLARLTCDFAVPTKPWSIDLFRDWLYIQLITDVLLASGGGSVRISNLRSIMKEKLGAIKSIKSVPLRSFINAYSNHFYISSTGKRVFLNRGA